MMQQDEVPADDEATTYETKRVKTQQPDLIVAVGSGDSMQEFECYKVILSFASSHFETMLSSGMRETESSRIEFPDKDPEEWKLFYDFVSPEKVGKLKPNGRITNDNASRLLPWFHEFQMPDHVKECDSCLARKLGYWVGYESRWLEKQLFNENETTYQDRLAERKAKFGEAVDTMKLALTYDIKSTKESIGEGMSKLMDWSLSTEYLFDLEVIQVLLQAVLPLQLDQESGLKMVGEGGCKALWPAFKKILLPHVSNLTQDILDSAAAFPLLVYSFRQSKIKTKKAKVELEKSRATCVKLQQEFDTYKQSSTTIINTFVHELPTHIYHMLPDKKSLRGQDETIASLARRKYKSTVYNDCRNRIRRDFNNVGFDLPQNYLNEE